MSDDSKIKRFILVVGVGRSGTSLLQSMLASNSDIAFLPETGILRRLVLSGLAGRALDGGGRGALVELLAKDSRFGRTGLDAEDVVPQDVNTTRDVASVYNRMLELFSCDSRKAWVGDKDPRLIEYLPVIAHIFPLAHVINIYRDPRDVLASKKRARWSRRRPSIIHVIAGGAQLDIARNSGRRHFGDRYIHVKYEALIDNPEKRLRELVVALGVEFDPHMLSYWSEARNLVAREELSWKKETLRPILRENTGKWHSELTALEVKLTEIVSAETMQLGNYDEAKRTGVRWQLLGPVACVLGAVLRTGKHIYRWRRQASNRRTVNKMLRIGGGSQ